MEHPIYKEMGDERPEGFSFPQAYLELISHKEEPNLYPWTLVYYSVGSWSGHLKRYFPDRHFIPFAEWNIGIDTRIACFEHVENQAESLVLCIDPFSEPDIKVWERYASFDAWLIKAEEQSRDYRDNRPELPYVPLASKLPEGFRFPQAYLDFIRQEEESDMYPWQFLCFNPDEYDYYLLLLKKNYPALKLVPFARWDLNGEIACFEMIDGSDLPILRLIIAHEGINFDEYDVYMEFENLRNDPYPTFEAWLEFARVWERVYDIETAGVAMELTLSDIRQAWDVLEDSAREEMEKRQPDFPGKLTELAALFKEGRCEEGLNRYLWFLLQTGILPEEELIFHMERLAEHCNLYVPGLDALKAIEDNPGGSTMDVTWHEIWWGPETACCLHSE